jgi:hypothetical protein
LVERGSHRHRDADEERRHGERRDGEDHAAGARERAASPLCRRRQEAAIDDVADREDQQGDAEPQRPGAGEEAEAGEIDGERLRERGLRVPGMGEEIFGHRADEDDEEDRRQAQPDQATGEERGRAFAVIGFRHEIPGDEKEQGHEEALQERLVGCEEQQGRAAGLRVLAVVPAAERAVGDGGMHAQDEQDHDPADVVDEEQPVGRDPAPGNRRLRHRRLCGQAHVGRPSPPCPKLMIARPGGETSLPGIMLTGS